MAHSVELILDPDADAAVRVQWAALARAGLPSLAHHRSPTNRPHVTLIAAERIPPAVDAELRALEARLPLECLIGAPVVFGRDTVTLVRSIVPSVALLDIHAEVANIVARQSTSFPHTLPGQWTPHVTLCRRLPVERLPAALDVVGADDIAGGFAGLRRWDGDAKVDHLLAGRDPGT